MRLNRADIPVAFVSFAAIVIVIVIGLVSVAFLGITVFAQLMKSASSFWREQSILGVSVVAQLDLLFFNRLCGLFFSRLRLFFSRLSGLRL